MAYFNNFDKVLYNFAIAGEPDNKIIVTNFLKRVKISNVDIRNNGAFESYSLRDSETPEIISLRYYGSMEYHWLVLMVNELFYGLDSFPKTYHDLDAYVTSVYGVGNEYDVHHYEDSNGEEVNTLPSGNSLKIFDPVTLTWTTVATSTFTAITNYNFEDIANENKRNIYLLRPEFLNSAVKEINRLLAE